MSDGRTFGDATKWTSGGYYSLKNELLSYFADVNGDNRADAIVVNNDGVFVALSNGRTFGGATKWTSGGYYSLKNELLSYFADINGDNRADAIVVNDVQLLDGAVFAALSAGTGSRFGNARPWNYELKRVRFYATADPQYENDPSASTARELKRDLTNTTIKDLNSKLRAGPYQGVVIAGDLTQNTRRDELFAYGLGLSYGGSLTGPESDIDYTSIYYDGLGNHDLAEGVCCNGVLRSGYCVCPDEIRAVVNRDRENVMPDDKSEPHYSWNWGDVHLVQLNLYPGATQTGNHDPMNSLEFLRNDLVKHRGPRSSRQGLPVILIHHYCLDPAVELCTSPDWWNEAEKIAYYDLIDDYNVIAIITGHWHNPTMASWRSLWRPATRTRGNRIPAFVVGATSNGRYAEFEIETDATTQSGSMHVKYHSEGSEDCIRIGFGTSANIQAVTTQLGPQHCPSVP
ncbi:protein of unknown function [uncultured Woeseiaceae bacterium]|uniref:Calcineurin-like phosphoesterase domain-containing protein n=1 Tax=uncultured Woeseiaceae bacterium TaxID=1983305 RepID=A0A7D9D0X3_9GAMM|nr:protein of unknown function [uncultured Woeseiaceae bacterium]